MCGYVSVSAGAQRKKELGLPEAGGTGGCELPDVGAGNPNQIPCKSNTVLNQLSLFKPNCKRPEESADPLELMSQWL